MAKMNAFSRTTLLSCCVVLWLNSGGAAGAYREMEFDVEKYGDSIAELRGLVKCSNMEYKGTKFPILCPTNRLGRDERFIRLLFDFGHGKVINFAVDASNLYIVGFSVNNEKVYLFSAEGPDKLPADFFNNGRQKPKSTRDIGPGNYDDIEKTGGARTNIQLGLESLNTAIYQLASKSDDVKVRSNSLLVIIQMIAEAARFGYIENRVNTWVSQYPDLKTINLQNKWGTISEQTQKANVKTGKLQTPFIIFDENDKRVDVKTLSDVIDKCGDIRMMLHK